MSDDVAEAVGRVREYTRIYLSGTTEAFEAARSLLDFILRITIMRPHAVLRWTSTPGQPANVRLLGVPKRGLPLKNGRYLDLTVQMQLDPDKPQPKLRVYKARFQYQMDEAGKQWVFRYDYIRTPEDPHPASHLQIKGTLDERIPDGTQLKDLHFPTGRIPLEAMIRCIVEQFGCGTHEKPDFWRPVLAASEQAFNEIAHKTISGPSS